MNRAPRAFVLGLAAVIAGCSSVPLPSLVQLSRINAQTTDLAALRVAVRLPDGLKPRADGVNMDVSMKMAGAADQKATLSLVETHEPADLSGLPAVRPGSSIYAYRLAPRDVERLVLIREAQQRQGGKGGSFGIATKEFCLVGALPSGPLLVTTYLLTSETRSYVVVTSDLDLRKEPAIVEELSKLKPC